MNTYRINIINKIYNELLNRNADIDGINYFYNITTNDIGINKIITDIKDSNEYIIYNNQKKIKNSINIKKINLLNKIYNKLLLRNIDIDGIHAYYNLTNSKNEIQQIISALKQSDEYNNVIHINKVNIIHKIYNQLLFRDADPEAIEFYYSFTENEESITKIIESIKLSTEYYCKNTIKNTIKSIIPLNLYTTWHTKDLPIKMKENVDLLKQQNPEFNFYLFDDYDCRNFIEENFNENVLNAFDMLIPGAYKADLWRYCVLYINGGIYLDIKFHCVNDFKLIELTDKEYFVRDFGNLGIYNAFMIVLPQNEIMLKCINQIVINVNNKYYGNDSLSVTGPNLLGSFYSDL